MKCPDCGRSTARGKIEKVRVLGLQETVEIDVIEISCLKCNNTLGIVNVPITLRDILLK